MTNTATTPEQYIEGLPHDRKQGVSRLRDFVINNLPNGFKEVISYGMLGYVVPHELYAAGYHCDPKQPLPFASIASQKNYISFYHMGIYAMPDLLQWFTDAYPKHTKAKLDMGKSCLRFKNPDQIPYELIGELMTKVSVNDWITVYENNIKRSNGR